MAKGERLNSLTYYIDKSEQYTAEAVNYASDMRNAETRTERQEFGTGFNMAIRLANCYARLAELAVAKQRAGMDY